MVEKVTVRGGGQFDGAQLENAASEATLLELIKAVKVLLKKVSFKFCFSIGFCFHNNTITDL